MQFHDPYKPLSVQIPCAEFTGDVEEVYVEHIACVLPREELIAIVIFLEYFSLPEDREHVKNDYLVNILQRYTHFHKLGKNFDAQNLKKRVFDWLNIMYTQVVGYYKTSLSGDHSLRVLSSLYLSYIPAVAVNADRAITLTFNGFMLK